MKVAIGADHRGFPAKEKIADVLRSVGHTVLDVGTCGPERTDYPSYAVTVARKVSRGEADRGILICSSGIGMSMAANKVRGVRCALCTSRRTAELSRSHNNSNVMALPGDDIETGELIELVKIWLSTEFLGGRYQKRNDMIAKIEEEECGGDEIPSS